MSLHFSTLDISKMPGGGIFLLIALAVALLTALVATALAAVAWLREPRRPSNWLVLACAAAALFGQALLFLATRWM